MTPDDFLASAHSRLEADGNTVSETNLPSGPVTIGYQGKFRWLWMATNLNLFTVVAIRPEATADALTALISDSVEYAKKRRDGCAAFRPG